MRPPRWKLAVVTWIGVYPLITVLLVCFRRPLQALPTPVTTLVLSGTLVTCLTYVVMPVLTRVFGAWLRGRKPERP